MAKAATRHKDDDDDGKHVAKSGAEQRPTAPHKDEALNPNPNTPDVPPAGVVVGPLLEEKDAGGDDVLVVDPQLASDVAGGFTPGTVPGSDKLSKINTDTPTYGTETPPRQTPPTSIDNAMKHSPPSFHDSNGQKIVSAAPTCSGISPSTGVAGPGAAITVTLTGTNFDRATFATVNGVVQSQSVYVSATSMTVAINPALYTAGVVQITAKNSAGESVQRAFTFT